MKTLDTNGKPLRSAPSPLRVAVLTAALALAGSAAPAWADAAAPAWDPVSSEQLIELPGNYLDRAVDRSLEASPLGADLQQSGLELHDRAERIAALRAAMNSGGSPDLALREQFLTAKDAYLEAMEREQALRGVALRKRLDVYRQALRRLEQQRGQGLDPRDQAFRADRDQARARLEASAARVDAALSLVADAGAQSHYGDEYAQNLSQIERLQAAIARHPTQDGPVVDGAPVSKAQYLRHLITGAEAELSLLAQEGQILGYMARLVALDARALEVEVTLGIDDGPAARAVPRARDVAELFIGS